MSLLQDEDFLIYYLRHSYLTHFKDGVGERLITLDTSALLNPAVRTAGLLDNPNIHRTYSPPIPVATAVSEEYFNRSKKDAGLLGAGQDDDDEDEGVAVGLGSNDTALGPGRQARRRRRRDQPQEADSRSVARSYVIVPLLM